MHDHSREIQTFSKQFEKMIKKKGVQCPSCNSDDITVNRPDCLEENCGSHHPNDTYYCSSCHWIGTAGMIVDDFIKERNELPCPCCHGTGFVTQRKRIDLKAAWKFWQDRNDKP